MKIAILNNKVQLVEFNDYVKINIIIPYGNIQKMIDLTGCKILKVQPIELNFHHLAGRVAKVEIKVMFGKIEKYLQFDRLNNSVENYEYYCALLGDRSKKYYTIDFELISDKVKLYTFGEPILRRRNNAVNGIYVNRTGKKISLSKIQKYVNFKGEYYRLIETK